MLGEDNNRLKKNNKKIDKTCSCDFVIIRIGIRILGVVHLLVTS
jgi:hypothetical protein